MVFSGCAQVGLTSCSLRCVSFLEKGSPIDRIQTRVNSQIRISPIRVIAQDGAQLGVITTDEALNRARDVGLDLVEVAPNEKPPVCRIMDFGKYKYEKSKKAGGQSHQTKTKEIRLRPKTGDHDIDTKVRQAIGFLQHKDKVQVMVIFHGREMAHIDEGRRVMESVLKTLSEYGKLEQQPQQQGKRMLAILGPK
ncbi:MAG: translation initiation factor IF-3 [Pirellulaceae bacterium]|nr:translation initiation factor IF-3 [Pirellulaceae bacterium]